MVRRGYRFVQADVFTARAFGGNQLAVFPDARGLSAEEMQTLAREMNFAETAFVLPPDVPEAIKRVRIFTPVHEMLFAGHPTVGATFVLAHEGVLPLAGAETTYPLQLNLGVLPVTITSRGGRPDFVWLGQRPAEFHEPRTDTGAIADALGVEAQAITDTGWPVQVVSTGVPYLIVPLRSLAEIRCVRPDRAALRQLLNPDLADPAELICPYVVTPETEDEAHHAHARMFNTHPLDLPEDAATGSAAGPLGAYLVRHNILPPGVHVVEQGYEMGRPSQIHVRVTETGEIAVGGQTVLVGEGVMYLP
jgi:trans-2,3-dihydro-3-hydroxyanthranilate isomerase